MDYSFRQTRFFFCAPFAGAGAPRHRFVPKSIRDKCANHHAQINIDYGRAEADGQGGIRYDMGRGYYAHIKR